MKKPLTDKARELTIRELKNLAPGDEAMQVAIINQSIQRGWQGVFALKDDKGGKAQTYKGPVWNEHTNDDLDRLMRKRGLE